MMSSFSKKLQGAIVLLLFCTAVFTLSGCSGSGSGSSERVSFLNVVLKTSLLPENSAGKQKTLPIEANTFLVELLDSSGKELDSKEAERKSITDNVTVSFAPINPGSYRVRVSAFDSNRVILGTYNAPVNVVLGITSVNVNALQAAEVYYSPNASLPQTENTNGLTDFLSHDQPGIDLQSYCIFGKLVEEGKPVNAFLSIAQRLDEELPDLGSYLFPIVIAGAGYNNPDTAQIIFGGSYGIAELTEAVTVTQPWHVRVESLNSPPTPYPSNVTELMIIDGVMGQAGAKYQIVSKTKDLEGGALETNVTFTDVMGFVNEGYGPSSFFPQWIYEDQRKIIESETYGGSVGDYLEATGDPMTDQGSYYYSAPMLQVDSFEITRNGKTVSKGTDGLLWIDVVYQAYDTAAQEVIKSATWNFFTIQIPKTNQALMVTQVNNDKTGSLPVASLFTADGPKTPNGSISPEFRWNIQDIDIQPVTDKTWTSPKSGETYYTQYKITLKGSRKADLTVTLAWDEQELSVNNTVKYEGYANVTGTLDGEQVEGAAWVELQPKGHL